MISVFVVAGFFLMILAPCLFALRSRRGDMLVPAADDAVAMRATNEPSEVLEASLGTMEEIEIEVLIARRALAMVEADLLAAEARLALARSKQASEQAAFASRAAAQAAEAVAEATRTTRLEPREPKPARPPYEGPVVDGADLPETHPSMDFPRSRVARRAA